MKVERTSGAELGRRLARMRPQRKAAAAVAALIKGMDEADEKPPPAKLIRRNGRTYVKFSRTITQADVEKAMADFP